MPDRTNDVARERAAGDELVDADRGFGDAVAGAVGGSFASVLASSSEA